MYSVTKEILQSARDKDNSEYLKMASLSTVSKNCMTKDETKNLMVNGTPECNDEKIQRDDVKVYIYYESGEMKCLKKMTPTGVSVGMGGFVYHGFLHRILFSTKQPHLQNVGTLHSTR